MILRELHLVNWKSIRQEQFDFSPKINCLIGLNGQGKTNILDAIYLMSFTKSAFSAIDSQNITHGESLAMVQARYEDDDHEEMVVSCGIKAGVKKQFRVGQKDYKRLLDHIGKIPLVMVSPEDSMLIAEGSEERRKFMDTVIAQQDHTYLEHLTRYNSLLKQRNALLKQWADTPGWTPAQEEMIVIYDEQMAEPAQYIFESRSRFVEAFVPIFQSLYEQISGGEEKVSLSYISQLQTRDLRQAMATTRQRDVILGWTSQGIHKDEIEMLLDTYPLKRVGSQGQQKTYLLAMKLAQALYLGKPILLLDDIFDKLDSQRVERILQLVGKDDFGQIFITDTDRQHLTQILQGMEDKSKVFTIERSAD